MLLSTLAVALRLTASRALLAVTLAVAVGTPTPVGAQVAPPAAGQLAASVVEQQYTILIYESPEALSSRNGAGSDAYWTAYDVFAATLAKAGVLRGGSALDEGRRTTVRGSGSADAAVRGARLGGYFVIAAADRTAAEAWARQAPPRAIAVEVRPHRANPHMAGISKQQ